MRKGLYLLAAISAVFAMISFKNDLLWGICMILWAICFVGGKITEKL
ncbi:MAG: hypothetical protein HRT87_04715 [Legionellales bacterium]|nr:hypothetical protein [Legionellales bacterium]